MSSEQEKLDNWIMEVPGKRSFQITYIREKAHSSKCYWYCEILVREDKDPIFQTMYKGTSWHSKEEAIKQARIVWEKQNR